MHYVYLIKSQKGVSILLTSLIMSVVLAISLGLSAILIQQTKMMADIGYSLVAFFAADSGIEKSLYNILKESGTGNVSETSLPNGATYEVSVRTPDGDCSASNLCLKSIGTYKEIKRAIEIKY